MMRDRLGKSAWWNIAPKNPTQTMFTRFIKSPSSLLDTGFSKSKKDFDMTRKQVLQTWISELFEEKPE